MKTTRALLSAAMGAVLLAGNLSVATAHLLEKHESWQGKVHSAYRNLRHCDQRAKIDDYLPGGRYAAADTGTDGQDGAIYEKVSFLTGSGFFTDRFSVDTAGTYKVTLTDFAFPKPLMETGLNITSATESFGSLIGAGSFTFDADPGNYYLSFFGSAPGLGQYGIEIAQFGIEISQPGEVSTVPVPAAAWLFGSGLIGLAGVIRRRSV